VRRAWLLLLALPLSCLGLIASPPPPADGYTVKGPHSQTYNGIAYSGGFFRIQNAIGSTLFLASQEDGAAFYDLASNAGDVDIFGSDGSFIDAGPGFGAYMAEGTSGAYLSATSGGDVHMVAKASDGSAVNAGPTYSGVNVVGSNGVIVRSNGTNGILLDGTAHGNIKVQGGTLIVPVLSGDPAALVDGMIWIDNIAATHELRFRAGGATYRLVGAP